MRPRSLPARVELAEQRAGVKRGIAQLDDDELVATIEAVRRIEAAREAGTEPAGDDLALAQRAVELYAETGRRG
jgi:hypothetical protein